METKRGAGEPQRAALEIEIEVECYAGFRGDETPRRFSSQDRVVELGDILDQWLAPDRQYFKVRGHDGACYILGNDVGCDRWELIMYDGTGALGGKPPAQPGG